MYANSMIPIPHHLSSCPLPSPPPQTSYTQLLFPGGAKEVNKRVGQEYQLFWKESPDFVRLAARCGAIIVPFAAVGADDAYDGECVGSEGGVGMLGWSCWYHQAACG
jgi:hypothetical protein